VLDMFPALASRLDDPAANLSGGQQQMLALSMAFLARPRLLLIDELSLGLAPVVVEQLLPIIEVIRSRGTTVILVEQSVNLALSIAQTAYFMEKGEIRFHGPTAELLDRPDILRSVFLAGAAARNDAVPDPQAPGHPKRNGVVAAPATAPPWPGPAGPNPTPALEALGLSVSFGGIRAVSDVTLLVAPGEIVGVIGPNGAGKTTLLDLISGFTRIGSGVVRLGGTDVTRAGPDRRARLGLGRSFQDALLFPAMTVEETITVAFERWNDAGEPHHASRHLPAWLGSARRLRAAVDELIQLLNLEAYRAKLVRELSTGTRRVVDLACVVAHHPSVVLLDEPSSGIAQRESEALGPLLTRIRDMLGAGLVVIEHDMPLLAGLADRLVALDQGSLLVEGTPDDVLHHPLVIASYLGENATAIARSAPGPAPRPAPAS
jgi:ABC-type branched-subunit amino acid transport system ATPase component